MISQARKTWQAKHHVYTKLPSNIKLQTDSREFKDKLYANYIKKKFDLEKQRTKDKEKKQTELRKAQNNDVMEKYREEKDFTNDACNEHDKKTP